MQWGDDVFDPDGSVNRQQLAHRVFGDVEDWQALCRISHPRIRTLIRQRLDQATTPIVVIEAAVLYEADWQDLCDAVVFVDAPLSIRLQRIATRRGWSPDEMERRESFQKNLNEKQQLADYVIDNSGDLASASRQVAAIFSQLINEP